MSITVTGKLTEAAKQHDLGDGACMFFIRVGKKEYDRKEKKEVWANYSIGLYAKGNQLEYYTNSLVKDAIVCVTGTGIILKIWRTGDGKEGVELSVQDARLLNAYTGYDAPTNKAGLQSAQEAASAGGGFGDFEAPFQEKAMSDLFGWVFIALLISVPAAWITHVIVCLQTAKYILLIAGGIVFPIGVIHGYGIWLGVEW